MSVVLRLGNPQHTARVDFRVSGVSAVEIELANGKHFQIGTDEPDVLADAIDRALKENHSS